jgi:RNA polymerase sigma-70 factor (ECF subfamily)
MDKDAEFVELLATSQLQLRALAISLVGSPLEADDILQNACMTLWQKRAEYRHDGGFLRWAAGVIYIETLRLRRRRATEKLRFDESLLATLAEDYLQHADELNWQREHLPQCLAKLKKRDRRLIDLRYTSGKTIADIAELLVCPQSTVYNALARIRQALHECLRRAVARDYHPS